MNLKKYVSDNNYKKFNKKQRKTTSRKKKTIKNPKPKILIKFCLPVDYVKMFFFFLLFIALLWNKI